MPSARGALGASWPLPLSCPLPIPASPPQAQSRSPLPGIWGSPHVGCPRNGVGEVLGWAGSMRKIKDLDSFCFLKGDAELRGVGLCCWGWRWGVGGGSVLVQPPRMASPPAEGSCPVLQDKGRGRADGGLGGGHRNIRRNVSSSFPSLLKGIDFCTYVYAKSHHNACIVRGHSSGCRADRDHHQRKVLSAELQRQGSSTTQPRPPLTSETRISSPEILNTSSIQTQVL